MMNDSKKLRNCKQKKCAFNVIGRGCRVCEECHAEPFLIDDKNCVRCWNCENDAGILRWDENTPPVEEEVQLIKNKSSPYRIK